MRHCHRSLLACPPARCCLTCTQSSTSSSAHTHGAVIPPLHPPKPALATNPAQRVHLDLSWLQGRTANRTLCSGSQVRHREAIPEQKVPRSNCATRLNISFLPVTPQEMTRQRRCHCGKKGTAEEPGSCRSQALGPTSFPLPFVVAGHTGAYLRPVSDNADGTPPCVHPQQQRMKPLIQVRRSAALLHACVQAR